MRRKNRVFWLDHDHWSCGRHLPAGVLPATIERCWLCTNKRPPMGDRPAPPKGVKPGTLPGPSKKKVPRSIKPKMIVAKRATNVDALASVTASPPPKRTAASKTAKKLTAPKATAKALPKAGVATSSEGSPTSGGQCHWYECSQIARPRSKYCSRNCSNKNARSRHKARK